MSDIRNVYSDIDIFVLKSEFEGSLVLYQEPDGWSEDSLQMPRHKDYHGIFVSVTNALTFRNEAIDYINSAYEIGGINANLRLTKYSLRNVGEDVKYVQQYTALADFTTKKEKDYGLQINFNSNELEDIIKSHESDTFEIERETSIDDSELKPLELFKTDLSGRTISGIGESIINKDYYNPPAEIIDGVEFVSLPFTSSALNSDDMGNTLNTLVTTLISEGDDRSSSVDIMSDPTGPFDDVGSSQMFIQRDESPNPSGLSVEINYDLSFLLLASNTVTRDFKIFFRVYEWNGSVNSNVQSYEIYQDTYVPGQTQEYNVKGSQKIDLEANQGVAISYNWMRVQSGAQQGLFALFSKQNLKVTFSSFYENSNGLSFSFFHDVVERLLYIMTGEEERFYSKYFGRIERGYIENGEGGLIGLMSGFWARAFDPLSDKYKSLQISLKDAITSAQAVFNIGVGIETVDFKQRLRFEKLEYFYQEEVVIKLPYQLNNITRSIDRNLFFSGTEIGYSYGGDYESEVGLDEPNTKTTTVTPIRKSDIKYKRVSKIRADDIGLEITRRKPQLLYPDEDTSMDDHNWWLDLKKQDVGPAYTQKIWSDTDRLNELPTGINAPEDFKGMFFSPLRMLFRHGFVLRAGMEPYYKKLIKFASSLANTTLSMFFTGEDKAYREDDDILVSELDRARFLPNIIEGEHPVDDDLMDLIKGTTELIINGEPEQVPNVYFKFEWINEKEEVERGYLLDLKPKGVGKFKFQQANENLIRN